MEIITEKKLREQLGLSRSTVHRYKKHLGMPHKKVMGKTFFVVEEVNEFLNKFSSHLKKYEEGKNH